MDWVGGEERGGVNQFEPNRVGSGPSQMSARAQSDGQMSTIFLARVWPEWFGVEFEAQSNGPRADPMGLLAAQSTSSLICGTASTVLLLVNLKDEEEGVEDIQHGIGFCAIILY